MAQLRSFAFLMTADRLAFITTNVISRTMASNLLFSTDIRKRINPTRPLASS